MLHHGSRHDRGSPRQKPRGSDIDVKPAEEGFQRSAAAASSLSDVSGREEGRNSRREGWLNNEESKHPLRSDQIVSGEEWEKEGEKRRKRSKEKQERVGRAAGVFVFQKILLFYFLLFYFFCGYNNVWIWWLKRYEICFIHFLPQVCSAERMKRNLFIREKKSLNLASKLWL